MNLRQRISRPTPETTTWDNRAAVDNLKNSLSQNHTPDTTSTPIPGKARQAQSAAIAAAIKQSEAARQYLEDQTDKLRKDLAQSNTQKASTAANYNRLQNQAKGSNKLIASLITQRNTIQTERDKSIALLRTQLEQEQERAKEKDKIIADLEVKFSQAQKQATAMQNIANAAITRIASSQQGPDRKTKNVELQTDHDGVLVMDETLAESTETSAPTVQTAVLMTNATPALSATNNTTLASSCDTTTGSTWFINPFTWFASTAITTATPAEITTATPAAAPTTARPG
jgi:chromosome segregation ATPase